MLIHLFELICIVDICVVVIQHVYGNCVVTRANAKYYVFGEIVDVWLM